MSDTTLTPQSRATYRRELRPDITLPNGKVLRPRVRVATDLNVSERTIARMNVPTTYVGNISYIDVEATLKIIGDTLVRRNQPPKRRRA
jgi:hypothetical protein